MCSTIPNNHLYNMCTILSAPALLIVCIKIFHQDIIKTIHTETQMIDAGTGGSVHEDLSTFVLVVMSHGARGSVIGSDDHHIDIIEMIELLSPANFPAMRGKPKIVIINACAGREFVP